MTTRRIYVASLADYNAGRLHGVHIPIEGQDVEEITEKVQQMLAQSREPNAEEWAIHDYEGFGKWQLGEWENFNTIALVGQALEQVPEDQEDAFLYWFSRVDMEQRYDVKDYYDDPDGFAELFSEEYRGVFTDLKDYLEETEEGDLYLGLHHLRQVAQEYDEHNKWAPGPKDATQEMLSRLEAYIDWDMVARDYDSNGGIDVERADGVGGVWIFEDQN